MKQNHCRESGGGFCIFSGRQKLAFVRTIEM